MLVSKYFNKPTKGYHSAKEYARSVELKILSKSDVITDLKEQVKYEFKHNDKVFARYVADFTYIRDGEFIVEDVKGFHTDVYKLKKRMMKAFYGIVIKET